VPYLIELRQLAAKIETTYGVDAVPSTTDWLLVRRSTSLKPLNMNYVDRNIVRPYPSGNQRLPTFGNVTLEIEVEMAGFGTAGPAAPTPALDALLRITGRSRTITPTTKVDYALVFPGTDSATIYWYQDGRLHKAFGCRAALKRRYSRNDVPVYVFSVMGLYGGVSAIAFPTADTSAFVEPVTCVPGMLVSTIFGVAGIGLQSLEIDDGQVLEHRNLPNQSEYIRLVNRVGKGSIEIETPPQTTYDFWAAVKNGTKGAMAITLGVTAGNIIMDTCPRVQVLNPDLAENQSLEHLKLDLDILPSVGTGNDESLISVR
jgi:hypothetical protein